MLCFNEKNISKVGKEGRKEGRKEVSKKKKVCKYVTISYWLSQK